MKKFKMASKLLVTLMCLVIALTGCNTAQQKTQNANPSADKKVDYPTKTIELVVPWSAGGGSDRFARAIADTIKTNNFLPQPIVIVNKPGSNGLIGASYVAGKPDDFYTIVTNVTGDIGAWLSAETGKISPDNFKPIAMLCWDEYVLMVKADSKFNSLKDLIEYSKQHPGEITFAGAGVGTVEQMLHQKLVSSTGAKIEYVPFEGGGEIMSAVLGGHITANWANPAEAASQLKAGKLKALAIASDKRLESIPNVPTAKEQGYDIVFRQYRGILGSKNMPDEYAKVIADALKKVTESPDFKDKYAKASSLTVDYQGLDNFKKVITETQQIAKAALGIK